MVTTAVFRSEARLQVAQDILDQLISSAVFSSELEERNQNKVIKCIEEHKRQRDIENKIRKGAISKLFILNFGALSNDNIIAL